MIVRPPSAIEFLTAESGAVTVDWVVLTGALVGLGLAVTGVVSGGLADLAGDINAELLADHVNAIKAKFATN